MESEVGVVVRLIWGCLNRWLYLLWHLNRMSLEGKMSNVGGRPFGERFFYGVLLFDGGCLGKVTVSKMEVVALS